MTASENSQYLPILQIFGQSLKRAFGSKTHGQEEEQLKGPVQTLLQSFGSTMNFSLLTKPESHVAGAGRPDIAVEERDLLCGYVELKAPGTAVRARDMKGRNKKQWQKFSASIPNLLYTNGNEWVLYRDGAEETRLSLSGDVTTDGTGVANQQDADDLERLLRDFFTWEPIVPKTPKALAEMLAPLCHLLRDDVHDALQRQGSNLTDLARQWREYLFPEAGDEQFADAYAQTLTYALLLARFEGETRLDTSTAEQKLRGGHDLLASALRLLDDPMVRGEIGVGVKLLTRSIRAVDPQVLRESGTDPWLYFYEDFLAAYDKKLRDRRGVYYTPAQVVQAQVSLVSELLRDRLGKEHVFLDDEVVVLDPAAGTGTYPLAVLKHAHDSVSRRGGKGAADARMKEVAGRVHAFELLVGPYAVAHLRVAQMADPNNDASAADDVQVYLTDTLESPHASPPDQLPIQVQVLGEEQQRALQVKKDTQVLVCLGNPPYDREQAENTASAGEKKKKGGWVRYGEAPGGSDAILRDFTTPARDAGAGGHLKNLYNDYVYFWRWALWKVFEAKEGPGVVSFITASSYLRGPGFVGMREAMRRRFDELWIIDLEGDSLGARKTENVFAIRTPVAIAVGVRYGESAADQPAVVRYAKIAGSRAEKLAAIGEVEKFEDLPFEECFDGWQDVFLPKSTGEYFSWPLLTDVFPWQHSGVQLKRNWPIGETKQVLERRWEGLLKAEDRAAAYRETDRKITKQYGALDDLSSRLTPLNELSSDAKPPEIVRYGYRSFDRHWIIRDSRLGDRMRPVLWQAHSEHQVYMTSLLTEVLGSGPAATFTAFVPDLHHFSGRGGKDTIPLWRDSSATEANVVGVLLEALSNQYGQQVSAEELFAYACAVLGSHAYTERFWDELTIPGLRLPITKNYGLFRRGVELGSELVCLHTFGERFCPAGKRREVPAGRAKNTEAVPSGPEQYPDSFSYDPDTQTLTIGATGEIAPVSSEVWEFEVSGHRVLYSWLAYRMADRAGRKSSSLDGVRPESWTWEMTDELLELIWTLEACIELELGLTQTLEDVLSNEMFSKDDLPAPAEEERKPPKAIGDNADEQEQLTLSE